MPASVSIDALRRTIIGHRPGATIWGLGDEAHQQTVSGHNEDDRPGVRAEMQDADSIPEYRAIDTKIDANFTAADARALLADLITEPANRARLLYVIYDRRIYRRATGYASEPYDGSNPHTGHLHASGHASDDANGAAWHLPRLGGTMDITELHALLTRIVNADDPTERQVRDMITGGVHSRNPNGFGLLSPAVKATADTTEVVLTALAGISTQLAELAAKVDALPAAQVGIHTHAIDTPLEPWQTSGPVVDS